MAGLFLCPLGTEDQGPRIAARATILVPRRGLPHSWQSVRYTRVPLQTRQPCYGHPRSPHMKTDEIVGDSSSIDSILQESRQFPPPPDFARKAHISSLAQYEELWNRAKDDPEGFWAEQAQALRWSKTWDKVLDWSNPPFAKWF